MNQKELEQLQEDARSCIAVINAKNRKERQDKIRLAMLIKAGYILVNPNDPAEEALENVAIDISRMSKESPTEQLKIAASIPADSARDPEEIYNDIMTAEGMGAHLFILDTKDKISEGLRYILQSKSDMYGYTFAMRINMPKESAERYHLCCLEDDLLASEKQENKLVVAPSLIDDIKAELVENEAILPLTEADDVYLDGKKIITSFPSSVGETIQEYDSLAKGGMYPEINKLFSSRNQIFSLKVEGVKGCIRAVITTEYDPAGTCSYRITSIEPAENITHFQALCLWAEARGVGIRANNYLGVSKWDMRKYQRTYGWIPVERQLPPAMPVQVTYQSRINPKALRSDAMAVCNNGKWFGWNYCGPVSVTAWHPASLPCRTSGTDEWKPADNPPSNEDSIEITYRRFENDSLRTDFAYYSSGRWLYCDNNSEVRDVIFWRPLLDPYYAKCPDECEERETEHPSGYGITEADWKPGNEPGQSGIYFCTYAYGGPAKERGVEKMIYYADADKWYLPAGIPAEKKSVIAWTRIEPFKK